MYDFSYLRYLFQTFFGGKVWPTWKALLLLIFLIDSNTRECSISYSKLKKFVVPAGSTHNQG
jgi:hypothetical protein